MADDTEDVLDSWEDADAEVLERRMEERQKQQVKEKRKMKQPQSKTVAVSMNSKDEVSITPLEVQTHLPLRTQDPGRTEYVAPIKILKRNANSKGQQPTAQSNTVSPVQRKSLAEREAEYASARARILGSDYQSAEDISGSPNTTSKPIPKQHLKPHPLSAHGGSAESVNRQPKGPNGTKGFKSRAKS